VTNPILLLMMFVMANLAASEAASQWNPPAAPVIPEANGYISIPNAAVRPEKNRTYRAIFDVTRAAKEPSQLVPGLNMAGAELNAMGASGVPLRNARFAVVFHGPAVDGILDDAHYQAKFGVPNPNLKVLAELKKAGVELFVCGQTLAHENIRPNTISPDVTVASAALIVLMTYQNDGYALLSF
jgi:intracellular sulfur oxidation DsrE/DsrF family protein